MTLQGILPARLRTTLGVAADDAAALMQDLHQRLRAALVAMMCLTLCLVIASAWIGAEVWNTSWRVPVLATMLGIAALAAVIFAYRATRPPAAGYAPFARFLSELDGETGRSQNLPGFPRSKLMRAVMGASGLAGLILR